ncbi:hypothetical protein [Flavobacterium psychrotolerans]|uniref:Uncharacterized protein n=1 Tax=Flavobacterium psychrotolerans TaxID=2169410 RepID=A0A2U1JI30_9FLAO|nr:hypothetical protein [Flavobacterium psychrotolerans]PWA04791.1 hypothetical protein DB895_09915 [Flavobacterium psychrotolerans]
MGIVKTLITLFALFGIQISIAQSDDPYSGGVPLFDKVTNCNLRYSYFPNIEAYFDTQKSIYYYKENGEWKTEKEIPEGYRGYSIYNKISVYITDYEDDNVCQFLKSHKKLYPYSAKGRVKQVPTVSKG